MLYCPICKSKRIESFSLINDLPLLLFPVSENLKDNIISKTLTSYKCKGCNHIFTDPISHEEASIIYGQYYSHYPFDNLDSMNAPYRWPFEKVFSEIVANFENYEAENLLEIGCSSGKQLEFFKKFGIKAFGIDPSPLTNKFSTEFISGVYGDHHFDEKFDIIVSRFNLEHLNDVDTFFQKVRIDLNDNGFLFIQVPNIQTFAENLMPLFSHEHIHYFNVYSLYLSANQNGFRVIMADYENAQSIIFVLQKNNTCLEAQHNTPININRIPDSLYENYLNRKKVLQKQVEDIIARNTCYLYGAGLPLCWILYELNFKDRLIQSDIIDDNLLTQGKYLPRTDSKIKSLEEIEFLKNSTFLLTLNPAYHERVTAKILAISSSVKIYAINKQGLVLLHSN